LPAGIKNAGFFAKKAFSAIDYRDVLNRDFGGVAFVF